MVKQTPGPIVKQKAGTAAEKCKAAKTTEEAPVPVPASLCLPLSHVYADMGILDVNPASNKIAALSIRARMQLGR